MANDKFPPIPKELLEALEKRFPETPLENIGSVDQLRLAQGELRVVRFLRAQFEKQTKNILENT
ncbi:hypothetical protein RsoPWF2_34 [Ralstonia phage vRsoP-WF2]|nr:hypothetical protein RsoPWF2_34 [Ralstonia phage vRsoP-WF2]UHX60325.1 hypothetical protein RsoPWM2_34 [Ralstonia phage vRsoP-WM2]UHX60378.1 hypothetical protein RsoPWR2_35 [Ralstonia phage vRsoP-WR2]